MDLDVVVNRRRVLARARQRVPWGLCGMINQASEEAPSDPEPRGQAEDRR